MKPETLKMLKDRGRAQTREALLGLTREANCCYTLGKWLPILAAFLIYVPDLRLRRRRGTSFLRHNAPT